MHARSDIDAEHKAPAPSRAFWWGILIWTLVCIAGVLLRGIRWEEGYERAQVLLGLTPYPDGHPHARWYWNAFSIHYYASAALLWLTQSAAAVCGSRQVLAALAVHLPVFGLVWVLTRRAIPAHVATLFSVVGAHAVFQSYMPVSPWANKATSGMIGTGWAFWVLAALCAGRWRTAGLLFGLMPLVHVGQWPILLMTALLWAVWYGRRGNRNEVLAFARYAAAGLLCCVAFAVVQRPFLIPPPQSGAYFSEESGHDIWAAYVTKEDMHRAPVAWPRFGTVGNSIMAMAGFLLLALPGAWREVAQRKRPVVLLLFAYGLLCTAAMAFAHVVHRWLGTDVPYIVVGWMPNRLTIHTAMLMLCGAAAWAFHDRKTGIPWAVFVALSWLAMLPLWPLLLSQSLVDRYFGATEIALFLVAGASLAALGRTASCMGTFRGYWYGALGVGLAALLGYHQLAAVTVAAGAGLEWTTGRHRSTAPRPWQAPVFAALLVAALAASLWGEWRHREQLPITPFEAQVAEYLSTHSTPQDMVLTPLDEHLQMVLNRPVVATFETRQHIGYMRSLAASADKLYADIYGAKDGHWYDWDLWMDRTQEAWQELGEAYGFRYVLSKEFHPLHLPVRLSGDGLVLYEIP